MQPEVNTPPSSEEQKSHDPTPDLAEEKVEAPVEATVEATAPASSRPRSGAVDAAALPPLAGNLRVSRGGPRRVVLLFTGLALLGWLGRGLLYLLGHRHPVTLTLGPRGLELVGERRLAGIAVGSTRRVLPLGTIRMVDLVSRGGVWTVVIGLVALALLAAIGITLLMWGIAGRQPSWLVLGLLAIGGGILLDALAHLRVRQMHKRGLADLEIRVKGARMRLCGAELARANQLVDRVFR